MLSVLTCDRNALRCVVDAARRTTPQGQVIVAKPSDFFVGVTDFFAVLLPGASVLYLFRPLILTRTPMPWLPATPAQGWALFLVLAYIVGHLLHAIGSWLLDNYVYGKLYVPRWRSSHWRAAKWIREPDSFALSKDTRATETLLARVYFTKRVNPHGTNYYDWCLSDLRVNTQQEPPKLIASKQTRNSSEVWFSYSCWPHY